MLLRKPSCSLCPKGAPKSHLCQVMEIVDPGERDAVEDTLTESLTNLCRWSPVPLWVVNGNSLVLEICFKTAIRNLEENTWKKSDEKKSNLQDMHS